MNENQNQDYTIFGGWLLVWYWCLIIGGVLTLLSMVLPALISISASFLIGFVYSAGVLVSIASVCISAVFNIRAAIQLKARKPQFFDVFLLGMLISLGGGIVSKFLKVRSIAGLGNFISSSVVNIIEVAIGLCVCIMYFSKSVRVNTYFGYRPLRDSRYRDWIKLLPEFIISDTAFDPSKIQQMGSRQQSGQQSQNAQDIQSSPDTQSQAPKEP